jgi:hypothetical protein
VVVELERDADDVVALALQQAATTDESTPPDIATTMRRNPLDKAGRCTSAAAVLDCILLSVPEYMRRGHGPPTKQRSHLLCRVANVQRHQNQGWNKPKRAARRVVRP